MTGSFGFGWLRFDLRLARFALVFDGDWFWCGVRRHREVSEFGMLADHSPGKVGWHGVVPGTFGWLGSCSFDIVNQVLMRSWAR